MRYDVLSVVFAVVAVVAAAMAVAVVVCGQRPTQRERAEAERRERVEWACWCDEWADTRAAQERFLERRGR